MNSESENFQNTSWKVSIVLPHTLVPSLEEFFLSLDESEDPVITNFEIEGDRINRLVEVYFSDEPNMKYLTDAINKIVSPYNQDRPEIQIESLGDIDWVTHSQKILKPIKAGEFYLFGSHDKETVPENKIPILMEAGQAFGTGGHETTKGCLLAINSLADAVSPKTALDIGCGSGILTIAMAKLWNLKILASDIDPIATQTANDNFAVNNVRMVDFYDEKNGVTIVTSDGFSDKRIEQSGPFDIIVANILSEPIKNMADDIVDNLSSEGITVLSGLLKKQENEILNVYEARGLKLIDAFPINDWQTLLMKKV